LIFGLHLKSSYAFDQKPVTKNPGAAFARGILFYWLWLAMMVNWLTIYHALKNNNSNLSA